MCFPSLYLTVDDRVDNLVPYDPMVRPYLLLKGYYKQPKHKDSTNTSISNTTPTLISKDEETEDVSIPDLPAQYYPNTKPSSATSPPSEDKPRPLTKRIFLNYIQQDMNSYIYMRPGGTPDAT